MESPQIKENVKSLKKLKKTDAITTNNVRAKKFLSVDTTVKTKYWFPSYGALKDIYKPGYMKITSVNGIVPESHELLMFNNKNSKGFAIRGEAYDISSEVPASGVILEINQRRYRTQYGKASLRLSDKTKNKSLEKCGFKTWLPMSSLQEGENVINIYVVSSDKKNYYKFPAAFGLRK